MSVKLIKLVDGSELVGSVVQETRDYLVVERPLILHYRFYLGGIPSVSFSRYMMFASSNSFTIQHSQVIVSVDARKAFADYYVECVEEYYTTIEETVDEELRSLLQSTEKEQALKKILEMMPTDKTQMN